MAMCLLCLELKQESSEDIRVTSEQWQNEKIGNIIELHFWTLNSINHNSWLCTDCWEILNNFHNFYKRIEEAHSYFTPTLKTELVDSNEDIETHLTDNNLQDIRRKQRLTTTTPVEETEIVNEEQPIPVDIETLAKTKHKSRDPLEKHLQFKTQKVRKVVKPEEESESGVNIKEEVPEDIENTLVYNATENREYIQSPTDFIGGCDGYSSSLASDNESDDKNDTGPSTEERKPRRKLQTRRKENDAFLTKHYKIACVICQTPMPTFRDLSKHFSKLHNEPAYVICCNRKYFNCRLLVDHVHCHLEPEYFKCKHCGKTMSDRRCLELHVKTHGTQTHVCDICQKGFTLKTSLNYHKLIHIPDDEKLFACEECGKSFGTNKLLVNHVRVVHLNKYALVCDICGEKMRGKDVFERHILKHKGVPIPTIACDVCGLKLRGQRGLKRHKDSQHPEGGKKEYPCHLCSKISPSHMAYKKHVRDKHKSGYDFKCTICEKAYKRACSLREHMATHTGTALYSCSHCPRTFNSNGNMHSHRKKMHPKEWEEECRAKYSGNLPPKYKTASSTVGSELDVESEGAGIDSHSAPWLNSLSTFH